MDIEVGDVVLVDISLIFGGDQQVFVEKVIKVEGVNITTSDGLVPDQTWRYNKRAILNTYKVKDIDMDVNTYMEIVMKLQGIEYHRPFKIV